MQIDIAPHSVIIMVGPSMSGKSYFCEHQLIPQLKKLPPLNNREEVEVMYISSDNLRRLFVGNKDKYDAAMTSASKGAFDVLYAQYQAAMEFPINSEFIIVDTKGTNDAFRDKIVAMAREHHYNIYFIIFNYEDYKDYFINVDKDLKFIQRDIKRTRQIAFSGLKKIPGVKDVKNIKKYNQQIDIISSLHENYCKCIIPNEDVTIISDIHGCYDEFIELLKENKIIVDNHKIISNEFNTKLIINGDYLDKGPKSLDMIDFCYENLDDIYVIIGNHENRLYKELTEDLEHVDESWFNTYNLLDDVHKERFIHVFENSLPFVKNDIMITTHAPVSTLYLGKVTDKAKARQRYFKQDKEKSIYEQLNNAHIFDHDLCNCWHIFGHLQTFTPCNKIKRRILIDGACAIGGTLNSLEITEDGRVFRKFVQSHQQKEDELKRLSAFAQPYEKRVFNIEDLDYKDKRHIERMVKDKVNFISGTMSPCDKLNGELESIESAIEYFKSNGVNNIVIQPKYMGSRCNMYLTESNETSYCVSRNGWKIDQIPQEQLYPLYEKMRKKFSWDKLKMVIIDGELMPWSALGEGIIRDFIDVEICASHEAHLLEGFERQYKELLSKMESTDFISDSNTLKKNDMIDKYGNSTYSTYSAVNQFKKSYINYQDKIKMSDIYREQLRLYGTSSDLDYKPFMILKEIHNDGTENVPYDSLESTNKEIFDLLADEECYAYDLNLDNDVYDCIKQFKKYTTEQHHEGVVMKPNHLQEKVVPYMKIRNPEYLTITYGYDYKFPEKYQKLYDRKSIEKKLKMSLKEFKTGLKMLRIPYDKIDSDEMKQLYADFIVDIQKESSFDPRL